VHEETASLAVQTPRLDIRSWRRPELQTQNVAKLSTERFRIVDLESQVAHFELMTHALVPSYPGPASRER